MIYTDVWVCMWELLPFIRRRTIHTNMANNWSSQKKSWLYLFKWDHLFKTTLQLWIWRLCKCSYIFSSLILKQMSPHESRSLVLTTSNQKYKTIVCYFCLYFYLCCKTMGVLPLTEMSNVFSIFMHYLLIEDLIVTDLMNNSNKTRIGYLT